LTLAPEEEGDYEVLLFIFSNDPDEDEHEFPITFNVTHQPGIDVDPNRIDEEFPGADVIEREIVVQNTGLGTLRYNNDIEFISEPERDLNGRSVRSTNSERFQPENRNEPERDDPGEIVHEFQLLNDFVDNPNDRMFTIITHSLAWDTENEWMWAVNTLDRRMIAINPNEDYRLEEFWLMNVTRPFDLAYYDGTIYSLEAMSTWLVLWDTEGNNLGRLNLDIDGGMVCGVAIDPVNELLIVLGLRANGADQSLYIFSLQGEQIARSDNILALINNQNSASIEWVPTHDFGKLWVHTSEQLWQLEIDTENWEIIDVIQHFHTVGLHEADGFAHDGENFWVTATENSTCQIIDDGIQESWISVDPIAGEIEADDEAIFTVTIDSRLQLPGDYAADIHIHNNDPENPEVIVPVGLSINPAPFITVKWPPEAGFDEDPQILDWNMFFPDIFLGQSYDIPITVQNLGHDILEVSNIVSENGLFSGAPNEFNLEPREMRDVIVSFDAEDLGVEESAIIIR